MTYPLTYPPRRADSGRTIGEGHGASSLAPSLRPGDIVIIDNLPPCPGARLGIVAAQGREGLKELLKIIADEKDGRLPIDARASLIVLAAQLQALQTMIGSIERRLTL